MYAQIAATFEITQIREAYLVVQKYGNPFADPEILHYNCDRTTMIQGAKGYLNREVALHLGMPQD
jgi:hypothetical protein